MSWGNFLEAILLGTALAMDAMAASVALGAVNRRRFNWQRIALTAVTFGGFQFFMPLLGFAGSVFADRLIQSCGSYIAGILLIFIGGKMFWDGSGERPRAFTIQQLLTLAFATSIDALLVGVSYRCMARSSIIFDVIVIGVVTALLAALGGIAGRWSGKLLGKRCTLLGAVVLILLGIKVIIWS